jgi:hypothetical protein
MDSTKSNRRRVAYRIVVDWRFVLAITGPGAVVLLALLLLK